MKHPANNAPLIKWNSCVFMDVLIHIVKLRSRLPQATYGNDYPWCLGYLKKKKKLLMIENEMLNVSFLSADSLVALMY